MYTPRTPARSAPVKQIILHVRPEFELPAALQKASLEEVEEILVIGANVQGMIRTRRSTAEIQKVTEMKDAEIARIQGSYQEKLGKLVEELRSVSEEKERVALEYTDKMKESIGMERETMAIGYEEKLRALRAEHEAVSSRLYAVEAARRVTEEARDRDIASAVARTEETMVKLVEAKEAELERMRGAYERMNESIRKQTEELGKLSTSLGKRAANVRTKGSDYEEEFGGKLRRHFGVGRGFTLTDTRLNGAGHAMDYSMTMEGHVVMWELKNYSATVPKAEVDKFLRDMKENSQCQIGVMISRSTDIYGKAAMGPMLTEFDGEKMMIYLSRFEEFCGDDEGRVFQMLMSLFRIWWEYHREENAMFDREELVRELEKAVEDMSRRRTEWRRHKAHLEEISRWTTDLLDESEMRMDRLLKRARNTEALDAEMESVEYPDDVFRESKEDKDQQWMQSIMRVCAVGGEIEVRELVELLSQHHRLSRDTIRSNVMAVIRDDAVFKKSVVKYVRGICKRA